MENHAPFIMNYYQDLGRPLPKYQLFVHSEITDLEHILTNDFEVTTATHPFVPSMFAAIKIFEFRMEDAFGHLVAGCKSYFANSAALKRYGAPAERVFDRIPVPLDDLRDRFLRMACKWHKLRLYGRFLRGNTSSRGGFRTLVPSK